MEGEMKKRERKLMKLIKHQQFLTLRALDIIAKGYDAGTAKDSAPAAPIKKPDMWQKVTVIEPEHLGVARKN
jgi:hypothetical protein